MFSRELADNYYQMTCDHDEITFSENGHKYRVMDGAAEHPAFGEIFKIINEDIECFLYRLDEEKFFITARDENGDVQWYYMDEIQRSGARSRHINYKMDLIEELLFQVIERSDFDLTPFIV